MSDEEQEYEKEFVLVHLTDTSLPGLYVLEAVSKLILSTSGDGATEGDDDEVVVQYGISNCNPVTEQRRKVTMTLQTQGLWLFPAHGIDQVDDDFCLKFCQDHRMDGMGKIRLRQLEARLLDARRFKTLAPVAPEPKKYASFSMGGSSKARSGVDKASSSLSRSLVEHRSDDAEEELGVVRYCDIYYNCMHRRPAILFSACVQTCCLKLAEECYTCLMQLSVAATCCCKVLILLNVAAATC